MDGLPKMHHKGYDVWVTCDGEQLPEYQTKVEGDQGKNVACYIPSESGKVCPHLCMLLHPPRSSTGTAVLASPYTIGL